ncbi:hypothetical protein HOS22_gp19 [Rhizobium phage RHEph08]|uniref:Uncharacterized protein n=3 Tax=Cuernavacavirus TaxID=2731935 RepID=L7TK88_9CAUD|nr:hypothetical protein HOS21_gp19 [Rhizobium phage RHEph02]YP_009793202.1 hypothetical protein HOS22_gp19 [Rhizobium phage RHEph08]YP_009793257.1 hypothetical protein HOS23_gp15 [Rhizobium phage RHEph09]AGC35586.1 hypothetical protein RHEph02_gp019 [Rhizobium phage RHEph02]AGC35943.1 hypothetical protein RHEph08_gp019 [Rhizobium phage RHEph08]AGC35998.1 hypothetical protein RHEph09_gp015 [Rhizobium phage RHEph09]
MNCVLSVCRKTLLLRVSMYSRRLLFAGTYVVRLCPVCRMLLARSMICMMRITCGEMISLC